MNRLVLTSEACESLVKFKSFLKKGMRVAFISTAADPYKDKSFVENDRNKLIEMGLEIIDYDIKKKNASQLLSDLNDFNVIFVSGGNTFYLLEKIRESGFDKIIKKLLSKRIIYIGSSAGSIVVGPSLEPIKSLDDPSIAKKLKSFEGLGIVDFVVLPHTDNPKYSSKAQKIIKDYGADFQIVPLKDSQAVLVEDSEYRVL